MRSIQLYATGSASGNNLANVTIPTAGQIRRVNSALRVDSITDNAGLDFELSLASAAQTTVNGALNPFLAISWGGNFVTSGLAHWASNDSFPVMVPIRAGDQIYMNLLVSGTVTYIVRFIIWYG